MVTKKGILRFLAQSRAGSVYEIAVSGKQVNIMARQGCRNSDCSVYVGNLDKGVTEELLWELLLQAGPIKHIHIPCDKETGTPRGFGFVEFSSSISAHYAWELLDGIKLFDRALTIRPQQKDGETTWTPTNQIAANIFYNDFYNTYDELKRRPQSEPRRSRQEEESYHHSHMNNSFTVPFNRSFSSPAYQTMSPPARNWSPYNGSPFPVPGFSQIPPSHPYWYH